MVGGNIKAIAFDLGPRQAIQLMSFLQNIMVKLCDLVGVQIRDNGLHIGEAPTKCISKVYYLVSWQYTKESSSPFDPPTVVNERVSLFGTTGFFGMV